MLTLYRKLYSSSLGRFFLIYKFKNKSFKIFYLDIENLLEMV